jgi:hypothetical protein
MEDVQKGKETHGIEEFADLILLLCNSHSRRFDILAKIEYLAWVKCNVRWPDVDTKSCVVCPATGLRVGKRYRPASTRSRSGQRLDCELTDGRQERESCCACEASALHNGEQRPALGDCSSTL